MTGTRVTETEVDGTEWSWIVSDDGWLQGLYILKWLVWSAYSVPWVYTKFFRVGPEPLKLINSDVAWMQNTDYLSVDFQLSYIYVD